MYPPASFHFRIVFKGLDDPNQEDTHFQFISGLEAIFEKNPEDDKNNIARSSLILKRAAKDPHTSALSRWLFSHFNKRGEVAELPEASIELLDETNSPYMVWIVRGILPRSWKLSDLNAEKSEVLIETIELFYRDILFLGAT